MLILAGMLSAKPIPVEDLFRDYEFLRMEMSPDGKWLASVFEHEPEKDVRLRGLGVLNIDTGEVKVLQRAKDVTVLEMEWVGDDRLMATLFNKYGLRSRYSFNVDGSEMKELVPPRRWSEVGGLEMLHPLGSAPDEILVARRKVGDYYTRYLGFATGSIPRAGVHRLNIRTGETTLLVSDPGWTESWFTDTTGKVRVAVGVDVTAMDKYGLLKNERQLPETRVFWIDDNGEAEIMPGIMADSRDKFTPLGFEANGGRFLFAGRQGNDLAAVYAWNPVTREVEGPVFQHERVDLDRALLSAHDRSVVGIWVQDGLNQVEWTEPMLRRIHASLAASLPGLTHVFVNWSRDMQRMLILSTASDEPGRYYLLDRTKGTIAEVYRRADWLKGLTLGKAEPVDIPARDGEIMSGYLTRPPGSTRSKPYPLVLLVHGGPWGIRDRAAFDPEVQFYATRGYAVLQVNYRGSGGYGRRFEELAYGQFGRTMQTDLDDAVDWAVAQGVADPQRLLIAGASYGGYATLMGLITQPERFRAGVAMFPVADLVNQIQHYEKRAGTDIGAAYAAEVWKARVGDPDKDAAALAAVSPMRRLNRISAPLFIVYGEDDPRINFRQSADLVQALRQLRKKFVRFAPHREGHGLYQEKNRFKVYAELEKFISTHMEQ